MNIHDWFSRFTFDGEGVGAGAAGGGAPPPPGASGALGSGGGSKPGAGAAPGEGAGGGAGAGGDGAGAGTGGNQPWYSTLDEGPVRDLMKQKNYANPSELANAYWNLSRLTSGGTDVVQIPPADAPPEQVQAFRSKIGVPADPAGYDQHIDLSKVPNVSEDLVNFAKEAFHKAGLPGSGMQAVIEAWEPFVADQMKKVEAEKVAAQNAEVEKVKGELGPEYQTFVDNGRKAVKALGLDDATLAALEESAGTAPIMRLMAQIGSRLSESRLNMSSGGGASTPSTPAEAQAALEQRQADKTFMEAYNQSTHPGHRNAVAEMERLFAIAYGQK